MWEPAPSPPAQTPCAGGISQRGTGSYPVLQPVQPGGEDALTQGWTGPSLRPTTLHPCCSPSPILTASGPRPSSRSWLPLASHPLPAR